MNLYQSIAVPKDLKANRGLTVYGLLLHVFMVFMMVLSLVIAVVALVVKIRAMIRRTGPALGLFGAGLGQVIMGVVKIAWGGAPPEKPGLMYWSWPVIQVVCTVVVWAWSRVLARLIEVASLRGVIRFPPRKGAIGDVMTGRDPVLASTRLGRVLFWVTAVTMLSVLLMFAFWGLFVY